MLSRELAARTLERVLENPFIPVRPTGKQLAFLSLPHKEAMFGGAAGGGKSAALLMAGLLNASNPNYAGIIFRKTLRMLEEPGALIPMSQEWLAGKASWSEQKSTWTFPEGGSLSFRYLAGPQDHLNYQGAAYHFIGFDEATQILEKHYRYLFSRSRKTLDDDIELMVRCATNPGGPSHEFFKQRFIKSSDPYRSFIASRIEDNPYLDAEDYEAQLRQLGDVEYHQLRSGDWDVDPKGGHIDTGWINWRPSRECPHIVSRFIVADTATETHDKADYSVIGAFGQDRHGDLHLLDLARGRWTYDELKSECRQMYTAQARLANGAIGAFLIEKANSGATLLQQAATERFIPAVAIPSTWAARSKKERAAFATPHWQQGRLSAPDDEPWSRELKSELALFGNGGKHDDQCDVLIYGTMHAFNVKAEKRKVKPKPRKLLGA